MDSSTIEQLIKAGLPDAQVKVKGEDGVHFEAVVISQAFAGKTPIQCHRLVYATLGSDMGNEIHALSLDTRAPENGPEN